MGFLHPFQVGKQQEIYTVRGSNLLHLLHCWTNNLSRVKQQELHLTDPAPPYLKGNPNRGPAKLVAVHLFPPKNAPSCLKNLNLLVHLELGPSSRCLKTDKQPLHLAPEHPMSPRRSPQFTTKPPAGRTTLCHSVARPSGFRFSASTRRNASKAVGRTARLFFLGARVPCFSDPST